MGKSVKGGRKGVNPSEPLPDIPVGHDRGRQFCPAASGEKRLGRQTLNSGPVFLWDVLSQLFKVKRRGNRLE